MPTDDAALAELIARRVPNGGPGLILLVLENGTTRAQLIRGLARVIEGSELREDTIFYVGSIAKQFVAASIALLEREGALSIDDTIASVVDDLPTWGSEVTIDHLLHHVSGLVDPGRTEHMGVPVDGIPAWSNESQLARVRALKVLPHPPCTHYIYANRGYLLLAHVVERASGQPLSAFARARIFEPLGMKDSMFRDRPDPLPARAARGHFEAIDGARYEEPARFHAV
ncbi:MAG: serine hydrolase, partial [Actinomycetota bacterium]